MDNIFLIEDHDEALKVWRKGNVNGLSLVHIDAHIDFGYQQASPIEKIVNQAKSLKDLKRNLEYTLSFMQYEKDLDKQTNIGNYIYPAMEEGIVRDFYWVVPGGIKEFRQSEKFIKSMVKSFITQDSYARHTQSNAQCVVRSKIAAAYSAVKKGIVAIDFRKRRFTICVLEKLPVLRQKILLDIDTDFLVIDGLVNANNTAKIGKRKPWILPKDLVEKLKKKIKQPKIITIAYSVNGGYTPMIYKHLGDEIAYNFSPQEFRKRREKAQRTAKHFNLFVSTKKKEYYQKAITLNPTYRAADNNYGQLYLSLRKFSKARDEFLKILKVDPKNPASLCGLGNIALAKRDWPKAKKYFSSVLKRGQTPFLADKKRCLSPFLLGLGRVEFGLGNFKKAKELLTRYQAIEPLSPHSYYLLGRIYEKEKKFSRAAGFYKDANRLGYGGIELMSRLLTVSFSLLEKDDIVRYVAARYKDFKKGFLRTKNLSRKKGKKIKGLDNLQRKMGILEKKLDITPPFSKISRGNFGGGPTQQGVLLDYGQILPASQAKFGLNAK